MFDWKNQKISAIWEDVKSNIFRKIDTSYWDLIIYHILLIFGSGDQKWTISADSAGRSANCKNIILCGQFCCRQNNSETRLPPSSFWDTIMYIFVFWFEELWVTKNKFACFWSRNFKKTCENLKQLFQVENYMEG